MKYVDGFVLVVPTEKLDAYRAMAETSGKVWLEHGALEFRECAADDVNVEFGIPFSQTANAGPDDTVIFSWIVYESREKRDEVNAKVMQDPRIKDMDPASMPFDCTKMTYGGFKTLVDLQRDEAAARNL